MKTIAGRKLKLTAHQAGEKSPDSMAHDIVNVSVFSDKKRLDKAKFADYIILINGKGGFIMLRSCGAIFQTLRQASLPGAAFFRHGMDAAYIPQRVADL